MSAAADRRDRASGGVLELFEARVRLESLREVLCTLQTNVVVVEIERLEGRVRLQVEGEQDGVSSLQALVA